jgi:hypothetical protein
MTVLPSLLHQDDLVSPYFSIQLAHKAATRGVVLVDNMGMPITLSAPALVDELGKVSNCTSPGLFVQCGYSHPTILSAFDQYVNLLLEKVHLPLKNCVDDVSFHLSDNEMRTCAWIGGKAKRQNRLCNRLKKHKGVKVPISVICPNACGVCA